jgi:CubicO group peptidase (beta-lactamase class C family)
MRWSPVFVLATLCLAAPAFAVDLEPILSSAMAGTNTPALAMLVMRDGKIESEAVRGLRRNDRNDPARIGDMWHLGSDGKPMTTAMIARLVDRGILKWTTPLSEMLPDLAQQMRPEYRAVTLLELLSHRSGLPHDVGDLNVILRPYFTDKRSLPQQRYAYVSEALSQAPVVPPGTKFSYSNTGFVVAAVIAERATGLSYEDLMHREIFGPLGMSTAGFGIPPKGQPRPHYHGAPVTRIEDTTPLMFAPAGNIHMSLHDWAVFCLDQMAGFHGRGNLLSPASYRLMQTPIAPGEPVALGWGMFDSLGGRKGPVLEHNGSDGTWYAVVALFPEVQNGILVATNSGHSMGGDQAAMTAFYRILPELAPPQ